MTATFHEDGVTAIPHHHCGGREHVGLSAEECPRYRIGLTVNKSELVDSPETEEVENI